MSVPPPPPPVPGFQFELAGYANKMRALSTVWFIYGAFAMITGIIGLSFAGAFFNRGFGHWIDRPFPPMWLGPTFLHMAWMSIVVRAGLAIVAGWGLMERTSWGRIVAIIAAIANILHPPFGTAMAIWTFIMLVGYRNATLYDQLSASGIS
jgi:hypothetical protein